MKVNKTLYIDLDLQIEANIKNLENEDFKTFSKLVINLWQYYFNNPFKLYGYPSKTTEMKRTTVKIDENLFDKINKYVADNSFSLITNELVERIYINDEFGKVYEKKS